MDQAYTIALLQTHQEALAMFNSGLIDQARHMLSKLLSELQFYLQISDHTKKNSRQRHFKGEYCSSQYNAHFGPMILHLDTTDNETAPMFCRARELPARFTMEQFSFIVLYNLALSTHLHAITIRQPAKQQNLLKASGMWELLCSLVERGEDLHLRPSDALAVLLNLGHARRLLSDMAGSNICYENILSSIRFLKENNMTVPFEALFLQAAYTALGYTQAAPAA